MILLILCKDELKLGYSQYSFRFKILRFFENSVLKIFADTWIFVYED